MTMTFNEWLESTVKLQEESFGISLPFQVNGDGELSDEEVEFIRWNVLAATDELHETLNEVGWKPWAKSRHVNREQYVGELVDVLHFVANLLCVVGVTGEELTDRYGGKQKVNAKRQRDGYDGVKEKCPGCLRAYDDPGVPCMPAGKLGGAWCSVYGDLVTDEGAAVPPDGE